MTTSTRLKKLVFAVAVTAICGLLPACYTLFQHPRIASLNYQRPRDKRCLNCHKTEQLAGALQPENAMRYEGAWADYYNEPWWFDSYLRSDSASTRAQSKEKEDTR